MNKNTNFENAELKVLIRDFLRGQSAIEYKYNPPSALEQEKRYARYGIKLPFKIHHEYKMPFGFESSYDLLFWLPVGLGINFPNNEKEWMELNRLNDGNMSDYQKSMLDYLRKFSFEKVNAVCECFSQISAEDMIAEIKRLNPELSHIKVWPRKIGYPHPVQGFICGVAYGFAPEDIDFWLSKSSDEMLEINDKDPRRAKLNHGHWPAPSRIDALWAAEEEIKKIEMQRMAGGRE